ncbi:hypothetical protein DIPPA_30052 [Diplonema papillatum]|nr:hypothetical protein DIPPA_30052 [Diplonema papillatum]
MLRQAAGAAVGFSVAAGCSFGLSSIVSAEERRRTKMLQGVVIGGGCAGALMAQSVEHLMDLTLVDRKTYFEFTPASRTTCSAGDLHSLNEVYSSQVEHASFGH